MKLSKALKEKKRLASEISRLKHFIEMKNSYIEGSEIPQKFDVEELYSKLQSKIQELVNLKIVINEANREIQSSIYLLGEYKAMIEFLKMLPAKEGPHRMYGNDQPVNYYAQIDELKIEKMIEEYQNKADSLQDQIDTYNYTTEVDWGNNYNNENK